MGWTVTARVQPQTNFNIHPSPSLSSISSLMEGGEPNRWEAAQKPLTWSRMRATVCVSVCVRRGSGEKAASWQDIRDLVPSSTSDSPAEAPSVSPCWVNAAFLGGIPTFSQGYAQLALTLSSCQMTQSSATCFPYLSFPRAVVLCPCPPSLSVTLSVVWCTVVAIYRISLMMACRTEISNSACCCMSHSENVRSHE